MINHMTALTVSSMFIDIFLLSNLYKGDFLIVNKFPCHYFIFGSVGTTMAPGCIFMGGGQLVILDWGCLG